MIRLAALTIIAIFILDETIAQETEQKFQRFGLKAGLNYSGMKFNDDFPTAATSGKINGRAGFLVGFILRVPLTKKLTLQPEYVYSERSAEVKNSHTIFKINYFSMPLLLAYSATDRLTFAAGPQLDLLIKARSTNDSISVDITHTTEERSIGATLGVSYRIIKSLQLEAQYYHGLSHIGIDNNTTEFSYRVFRINAAINF